MQRFSRTKFDPEDAEEIQELSIYYTDEIEELIDTMEGEKHDKSWISRTPYNKY